MKHPAFVHDRRWFAVAALAAVTVGLAGLLASRRTDLPDVIGLLGGAVAGALAVLGLPSLPTRLATVLVLGMSGVMVAHHSGLSSSDARLVLLWILALVVTLVAVERIEHDRLPAIDGAPPASGAAAVLRTGFGIAVGVIVAALLLAPTVQDRLRPQAVPGAPWTLEGAASAPASLRVNEALDMSTRPRLSDSVVLRVDADRPDFWRSEVFDAWDGHTWRRTDDFTFPAPARDGTSELVAERDALPAGGTRWTQTVRVEVDYAEVIVGAPTVVAIDTDRAVVQRRDGSAAVLEPFGRGATYTVTSVRVNATEPALRAADGEAVPTEILERYAAPPVISSRVAAVAEEVTAAAPTTFDKIRALEAWLGRTVEYSIEAPVSPPGVDAVDHFLFETRVGWCQQVSSSLAVMLRHLGVPARVAVGFVPGEYDPLAREYVVRERDAHQWVEVYFPGIGWQGFDPTADVPLAGEAPPAPSATGWLGRYATEVAVGLAGLGLVVAAVLATGRLLAARRIRRLEGPVARRYRRLVAIGRRVRRPPAPAETLTEYGRALAGVLGDGRAARVAAALDRAQFGTALSDDATLATVDADLDALADLTRSH